jgi:hypothetical protein
VSLYGCRKCEKRGKNQQHTKTPYDADVIDLIGQSRCDGLENTSGIFTTALPLQGQFLVFRNCQLEAKLHFLASERRAQR